METIALVIVSIALVASIAVNGMQFFGGKFIKKKDKTILHEAAADAAKKHTDSELSKNEQAITDNVTGGNDETKANIFAATASAANELSDIQNKHNKT